MQGLDRRWIFLAMLLTVAIPMLFPWPLPEVPTPLVKTVFQTIEDLPAGSRVLVSIDYDPASAAELSPMATAFLRHCCLKRHKIYVMTLWETAPVLVEALTRKVIREEFADANFKYGEDWINLGYKAGQMVTIKQAATRLKSLFPQDVTGRSLDDWSMTKDITSLRDFDLVINPSSGYPGTKEWIQYGTTPTGVPIVSGCTGVQAPQLYPYLPNQLIGMLPAVKGGAEYEVLLGTKYPRFGELKFQQAVQRMGPQLWAHLLLVLLIIAGNTIYFGQRAGWFASPGSGSPRPEPV